MFLLAKYGVQTSFRFAVIKSASSDLAASGDWTPATGDTKISKDGGNFEKWRKAWAIPTWAAW